MMKLILALWMVPSTCLLAQTPVDPAPKKSLHSFESDEAQKPPKGFVAAETAGTGTPAEWHVVLVEGAPDGKHALKVTTKNAGSTFNLLLLDREQPAQVSLSTRLRSFGGDEDQGGGLVWRYRDQNNYYVTRWNPLETNIRVYKVEGGKRTMFQSAKIETDAAAWHTLEVSMVGAKGTISFDQKPVLTFEDSTFAGAGKVGFWTKADASVLFDQLEIRQP